MTTILAKTEIDRIEIAIREFKGRSFLDIRQFFCNDDGEWKPTPKGITYPPDRIGELIDALRAIDEAETDE